MENLISTSNPQLFLHRGDITRLKCDAIVNAANSTLLGGGGVDGAIHRAAGPELLAECRTLHGCRTGEAKLTRGYNLPAKFVIHTVGPIYSGAPSDPIDLAACYTNSLNIAAQHDIHSIAFPAISTGVYHYPPDDAAKVVIAAVCRWLYANPSYRLKIIFSCFDQKTYDIYTSLLK